jgi:RNA polymerase sigma factor (sigma-70 family)
VNDEELKALVREIQQGDTNLLGVRYMQLVEELWPRLNSFLRGRFFDLSDADYGDVTEASITKIIMKLPRYKAIARSLNSWCFEIAKNTMLDLLKSRAKRLTVVWPIEKIQKLVEAGSDDSNCEKNLFLLDQLDNVLAHLGEECRLIITLRFWSKYNRKEIADELGITVSAVREKQEKCFEKARKLFDKLNDE